MTGLLVVLAVLVCIAFRLRPRQFPMNKRTGPTYLRERRRKLFDWLKDDPSPDDS